jgi:hypothetical protein
MMRRGAGVMSDDQEFLVWNLPKSFQIGQEWCARLKGMPVHLYWKDEYHMVVSTACVYDGKERHATIFKIHGPHPIEGDPTRQCFYLRDGFWAEAYAYQQVHAESGDGEEGPECDAPWCHER